MKRFVFSLVVAVSLFCTATAQEKESSFYGMFNRLGVGVGVGTEGIGIDVASTFNKYFAVRAGLNFMPAFKINTSVDVDYGELPYSVIGELGLNEEMDVKASLARTTVDLKFDCYPFGDKSSFFVTAGFSFGGSKVLKVTGHSDDYVKLLHSSYAGYADQMGIDLTDYNIPFNENGDIEAGFKVNGFRPYFGLGFGRLVPKNRVGFRFELGLQIHGKPKIYCDGLTEEELRKELDDADDDITKFIDKITVYPVLKFSLRGRIL